jgi:hypothetical protein
MHHDVSPRECVCGLDRQQTGITGPGTNKQHFAQLFRWNCRHRTQMDAALQNRKPEIFVSG